MKKDENMLQIVDAVMDILQYFVEDDDAPYVADERFFAFKDHLYNLLLIKKQGDDEHEENEQ